MRLKCGATAWTARPRLLSTHSRVASRFRPSQFAARAFCGPRAWCSRNPWVLLSHNLVLRGRVKNDYCHLLHFLTFSNKAETDKIFFICYFWDIYVPIIYAILCIDMLVVGLAPCHYLNQCWHTLTWTNFSGVHIKILTSFFIQERSLKISCAKRQPFCHSISLLDYENHRCYVSIQF